MEQKDIIDFANKVYKELPDATKADLLIREYIRNYEKMKNNTDFCHIKESTQRWLQLSLIFLLLACFVLLVFFLTTSSEFIFFVRLGLGVLFCILIGFSITSFFGFIKKW